MNERAQGTDKESGVQRRNNRHRMPTAWTALTAAIVIATAIAGCPPTVPTDDAAPLQPMPSGSELFQLITSPIPYQEWGRFPRVEGVFPSLAPHGPQARVLINGKVEQAFANFTGSLPDGAIIVKENFGENTSEKESTLTVMQKVTGFNPQGGDWFWAMMTPQGEVLAEGAIEGCIACHTRADDNDYVFVYVFGG